MDDLCLRTIRCLRPTDAERLTKVLFLERIPNYIEVFTLKNNRAVYVNFYADDETWAKIIVEIEELDIW